MTNLFLSESAKMYRAPLKPLAVAVGLSLSMHLSAAVEEEQKTTLQTVVVTAEKRDANLQEVPSSITAISNEEIAAAEIKSLVDVSKQTPNLHVMSWGGRRDTNIFIRGIGPGLFTPPTAGVYVDGVNMTINGMFDMEMLDVKSIEILRGPQGTLYGGNSLAGIINVTTRSPDEDPETLLTFKHDDQGRTQVQARTNNALIEDELYFSIAGSWVDDDGHIENTFAPGNVDDRDDKSVRAKFMWTPHDDFSATLALDAERFRGGSYTFAPLAQIDSNPDQIAHDFKGVDNQDSKGVSLNLEWTFDNFALASVTSWRDWENLNTSDSDGTATPVPFYHSLSDEEHTQFSQELRFTSLPDPARNYNWIAGLYYYEADTSTNSVNRLNFGFGDLVDRTQYEKEQSGYAAFGQVDYFLSDLWTLTAGLRYDHEERSVRGILNNQSQPSGTVIGDKDFDELLPKLVLSYLPNDNLMFYGSVAKGYRAGGFDDLYPNLADIEYDSEESINYELGMKTSLLDNTLELNTALFLIDLSNQQVQNFVGTQITTENVGASTSKGIELEARYIPTPGWMLMAGVSYTKADFDEYNNCSIGNCSGNQMPYAPEWNINAAVQNRQPIGANLDLFSRLDWQHIDEHYFDAANQFSQEAYDLVNLKIGVESEYWEAYLWGKNLLDEKYKKIAFDQGFGPMASAGDPRTLGMTVNLRF